MDDDDDDCTVRDEFLENDGNLDTPSLLGRYKRDPLSSDLLISVFMSALNSYRHDTVLRPFPSQFIHTTSRCKDIEHLRSVANDLPAISDIDKSNINDDATNLLKWILKPRNFVIQSMTENEISDLRNKVGYSSKWCSPTHVFKVIQSAECTRRYEELRADRGVFLAYHGSRLENFHSILHNGLAAHMNKNSVYGEGTYLSSEISVSLHYSPTGSGWPTSSLGHLLSCVAVCEVIADPSVKSHSRDSCRSRVSHGGRGQVPEKYYIATNNEMLAVRYLLLYSGKVTVPRSKERWSVTHWLSRHRFIVIMSIYVCLLAVVGLSTSKSIHRLWRKLSL